MAKLTLQASTAKAGVQPGQIHAGVNSVHFCYSASKTISISDMIQLCKIPDGAQFIDLTIDMPAIAVGRVFNIGTRADHDALIASATCEGGQVARASAPGLFATSFDTSDAAGTKSTMIELQFSSGDTTGSASAVIRGVMMYSTETPY